MAPVVLIAPDTSRLNVERAVRRVSAERRALVERLLRVQDRQAALAAWLLLERALEWRYGIAEMGPWAREPGGKPFLARHPLIHFNLSHTAGVAVCAVDDRPVGIDVERVVPLDPDVLSCVMSREEQASIAASGSPEEAFMRLWTPPACPPCSPRHTVPPCTRSAPLRVWCVLLPRAKPPPALRASLWTHCPDKFTPV